LPATGDVGHIYADIWVTHGTSWCTRVFVCPCTESTSLKTANYGTQRHFETIPAPTGLFKITHVTRDKPQLGKELGSMLPAQRGTNAALCRCKINWPCIHQDVPTYRSFGFVNSIHGTSLSMAFASDTIHGGIRRVCDKITGHVIAVENFTRTSFHVDARPPRTLSHIHTRARKSLHIRTRLHIHMRLSRNRG